MTGSELAQCAVIVNARGPDFLGRDGAPIWCVDEPTVAELRDLLRIEGTLAPVSQRAQQWAERRWHARFFRYGSGGTA